MVVVTVWVEMKMLEVEFGKCLKNMVAEIGEMVCVEKMGVVGR